MILKARMLSEQALLENRQYARSLISNIHEDILVIDRDYKITDVNNTFLVISGHKRNEIIRRHCYEITHSNNKPCVR